MTDFRFHYGGPQRDGCCGTDYPAVFPGGCCEVKAAGHNTDVTHSDKRSISKVDEEVISQLKKNDIQVGDTISLHIMPRAMFPMFYAFKFLCSIPGLTGNIELVGVVGDCDEAAEYDEQDVTPILTSVDFATFDEADCATWEVFKSDLYTLGPQTTNKIVRIKFTAVPEGGVFGVCAPSCFGFESSLMYWDPCFEDWFAGRCCSGACCN